MKIEQLGKSTGAENEILNILTEECSEVIQSVSKVFRFGWDSCNPSNPEYTNREHMTEEIGDLLCMVKILIAKGIIDQDAVNLYTEKKLTKLKKYSGIDLSYIDRSHYDQRSHYEH